MRINDYLPDIYDNNIQFLNIANTENIEFENLHGKIRQTFENTFINIANEEGINNFEHLLEIATDPTTEDLEFRRNRLISRLNTKPPFTERFLQEKLNEIMGEDNWTYNIVYNNYTLDIYALHPGRLWYSELSHLLEIIMPCNIVWTINIFHITWQTVLDNTDSWDDIKEMTWDEVWEGEWI